MANFYCFCLYMHAGCMLTNNSNKAKHFICTWQYKSKIDKYFRCLSVMIYGLCFNLIEKVKRYPQLVVVVKNIYNIKCGDLL